MRIRPVKRHPCRDCREPTSGQANTLCATCRELRTKAWQALTNAVHRGQITKAPACQACGHSDVGHLHGHHHRGYARADQLNVLWLCATCHTEAHRAMRAVPERTP